MCLVVRELVRPVSRSPTYRPVRASPAHLLAGLDHLFVCLPVKFIRGGKTHSMKVNKEVVVSAGYEVMIEYRLPAELARIQYHQVASPTGTIWYRSS